MERLAKHTLNSTDSVKKGQKLQSTVRFESETYSKVQRVSKYSGISFAEAVRRLVQAGLENKGVKTV